MATEQVVFAMGTRPVSCQAHSKFIPFDSYHFRINFHIHFSPFPTAASFSVILVGFGIWGPWRSHGVAGEPMAFNSGCRIRD